MDLYPRLEFWGSYAGHKVYLLDSLVSLRGLTWVSGHCRYGELLYWLGCEDIWGAVRLRGWVGKGLRFCGGNVDNRQRPVSLSTSGH